MPAQKIFWNQTRDSSDEHLMVGWCSTTDNQIITVRTTKYRHRQRTSIRAMLNFANNWQSSRDNPPFRSTVSAVAAAAAAFAGISANELLLSSVSTQCSWHAFRMARLQLKWHGMKSVHFMQSAPRCYHSIYHCPDCVRISNGLVENCLRCKCLL